MFVRNNTTCPNCGKCNTFDITFSPTEAYPEWTMRLECIDCCWGLSAEFDRRSLCRIFNGVCLNTPLGDLSDRARRAFFDSQRLYDSIKEQLYYSREVFVDVWCAEVFKPNTLCKALTNQADLGHVVSYFVSKPSRKYRFKPDHLLRTVGL